MSAHRPRVSHALGLALAAALGCAKPPPAPPATPATPATAPATPARVQHAPEDRGKLVVLLVVDQLPSWTFSRQLPAFHGGFARLAREGVYFPHAEYPYAATVTAIGHTALSTGAEPRRSGIVGNSWWDRDEARWVESTEDPAHPTVPPRDKDDGASPRFRVAPAVGEGRRVLSVSYKARAAILMAPSEGADVAWYDPKATAFVTSTQYAPRRPAWLDSLAREHPIAPRLDYVWEPLATTPERALVGDSAPGETDYYRIGTTFPHRLTDAPKPESSFGATPLASDLLVEAAIAGLDAVHPELLDISFSTHDLAAHTWGQESWEATDVLTRLDDTIGRLLDALDRRYGKDGWSLVFASDHGGPEMPERAGGVRIDQAEVHKAAVAAGGDPKWIGATNDRMIYLSAAARALPGAARDKLLDRIVAGLGKMPKIGFAVRVDRFRGNTDCTGLAELETLVCRSVYDERSGEIYYGPTKGSLVMPRPFEADSHGTPYDYDRRIPVIVREPGRSPRVVDDESPSTLRVAPTLARLLGAPPPAAAREPSL